MIVILFLLYFLLFILPIFPVSHIFRRMGINPALAIFCLIPLAGLVMIWVVAYSRWPKFELERSVEVF
jgi:hypothetical protein